MIEVDGPIHDDEEHKRYDAERTDYLMSLDIKVIRFTNDEVLGDIGKVLDTYPNTHQWVITPLLPPREKGRG